MAGTDDDVRTQQSDDPSHICPHLVGRTMHKKFLCVDSPEECDLSFHVPRKRLGIHAARARLQGMETLDSRIHESPQNVVHRTAGMQDHLVA